MWQVSMVWNYSAVLKILSELVRSKTQGKPNTYRSVVCMIIGKSPHVILGQEMLKPRMVLGKDEGELTGGKG